MGSMPHRTNVIYAPFAACLGVLRTRRAWVRMTRWISPWCAPEKEAEYLEYLAHERHMYASCLKRYAGLSTDAAAEEAMSFYPYEPVSNPYRGPAFDDEAWHWAMLRIHGEAYWTTDPVLEAPGTEYRGVRRTRSVAWDTNGIGR